MKQVGEIFVYSSGCILNSVQLFISLVYAFCVLSQVNLEGRTRKCFQEHGKEGRSSSEMCMWGSDHLLHCSSPKSFPQLERMH